MMDGIARFLTQDGIEVFSLIDGASDAPVDWFESLSPADISARLNGAALSVQFNAFLIRMAGQTILVDTGHGPFAGPEGAHVSMRLAALGVTPDQIDSLFFTHLHTDHSGGALTDGKPTYPNARVFLHRDEAQHWGGKDHNGARVLQAYAHQITLCDDGATVAPDVAVWHLPGHTPGHSGLKVGTDFAIVGDLFHAAALQFPDPALSTKYDVDPGLATRTRFAALAEAVDKAFVIAGSHAVHPEQFVSVVRDGSGFKGISA